MKKRTTKHKVGRCPSCGKRAVLGRCTFKGGGIYKIDHCRRCCDAPVVLGWKPSAAPPRARKTA